MPDMVVGFVFTAVPGPAFDFKKQVFISPFSVQPLQLLDAAQAQQHSEAEVVAIAAPPVPPCG